MNIFIPVWHNTTCIKSTLLYTQAHTGVYIAIKETAQMALHYTVYNIGSVKGLTVCDGSGSHYIYNQIQAVLMIQTTYLSQWCDIEIVTWCWHLNPVGTRSAECTTNAPTTVHSNWQGICYFLRSVKVFNDEITSLHNEEIDIVMDSKHISKHPYDWFDSWNEGSTSDRGCVCGIYVQYLKMTNALVKETIQSGFQHKQEYQVITSHLQWWIKEKVAILRNERDRLTRKTSQSKNLVDTLWRMWLQSEPEIN